MAEDPKNVAEDDESIEIPDFKQEYYWAFAALMLYKIGGMEVITLEQLEAFNSGQDNPDIIWNPEMKAFILKNKEMDLKQSKIITKVPNKIRKKILRKINRN